jgi:hypothetical protein
MRHFLTFRPSALRYWEKRRILYNAALVLPALFGYSTATFLSEAVGDEPRFGLIRAGLLFLLAAIGANICYSLCYAIEFFFSSDDSGSRWLRFGRRGTLVAGILFAIIMSALGGRYIGDLQFQITSLPVNKTASVSGGIPSLFHAVQHGRRATDQRC